MCAVKKLLLECHTEKEQKWEDGREGMRDGGKERRKGVRKEGRDDIQVTCDQLLAEGALLAHFFQGERRRQVQMQTVCGYGGGEVRCFLTDVFSFLSAA